MNTHDTSSVKGVLAAGTVAQDFTLHVTPDQTLSLGELRGKPVILAFFPADWSPVCGDQMALYNEVLPEFQKFGAVLLGISVDGRGVTAPLLRRGIFIFRCSRTLNPRVRFRSNMARTATPTEPASVRCS